VFVVHVGRRHHSAVRQPALAVHANVQLHAEIPLLGITQSMFPRAGLDEGEQKLVLEFLMKNAKQ